MTKMPEIGDAVHVRSRSASFAFPAVVHHVAGAAGRSATTVVVRPIHDLPKRRMPAGEVVSVNDVAGTTWTGVIGGSTDRTVGLLLYAAEEVTVDVALVRDDLVSRAKVAKYFEKLDVMLNAVNALGYLHRDLTQEEVELIVWCYKCVAHQNCTVLKDIQLYDTTDYPEKAVVEFRQIVEHLLQKDCSDLIRHIEEHLVPFSSQENLPRYFKLIGDLAFMSYDFTLDKNAGMLMKAIGYYEISFYLMKGLNFPCGDVSLLELILNFSTLLYHQQNSQERAVSVVLEVVNAVAGVPLSPESQDILTLIEENLQNWSSAVSQLHQEGVEVPPLADAALIENEQGEFFPQLEQVHAPLHLNENANGGDGQQDLPQVAEAPVNPQQNENQVVQPALAEDHQEEGPLPALAEDHQEAPVNPQQNENQVVQPALAEDHQEEGPLPAQAIRNAVPRQNFVPFEVPPLDAESAGNRYHGKPHRFPRKKKAMEKSLYG